MVNIDNLPLQLKENGLFCCWRLEKRDGKPTKVPYNPKTGCRAKSNERTTFSTLNDAIFAYNTGRYDGLGVGIFEGLCAIDIDHCVNEEGLSHMARDIVAAMDSYAEYSPSGTGIRILFSAPGYRHDMKSYYTNKREIGLEVYIAGATYKFVTVTGNMITKDLGIEERTEQLKLVLERYMRKSQEAPEPSQKAPIYISLTDAELIVKAKKAQGGDKFAALWSGSTRGYLSPSEADLALCSRLAFWTGRDSARMDHLFRQSGLFRLKWDERHGFSTYGELTIRKAIDGCTSVYDPQAQNKGRITIQPKDQLMNLADLKPEANPRYSWNDKGNGNLFADIYKDMARYVSDRKIWFVYDGRRWVRDKENLRTMELCKKLADGLMDYACKLEDERLKKLYIDHVQRWQQRRYRETILKDAASVYPVQLNEMDQDPNLFNCQNGTLDLRTAEFRCHRPGDLLSMLADVEYNPNARCERWERFIDEVMEGNVDKARFLQMVFGYALTGDTRYECFFILHGPSSRNGKGTCMETIMRMLSDYAKSAKPESFTQKQYVNGSSPTDDIARLLGVRLVNISEPGEKMVLDSSLIKTLTGNDTITARHLHENSFQYKPEFKLVMNTNHLPVVTDSTVFGSGRVHVIRFEHHFSEAEQDKGLKNELSKPENLSGVFNWCLEGLYLLEKSGFTTPDSVREATEDYRIHSDKVSRFMAEMLVADADSEVQTGDVYSTYQKWCQSSGQYPDSMASFKAKLEGQAVVRRKRPKGSGRDANLLTLLLGYRIKDGNSHGSGQV